jgi:hypothetical protein
MWKALIRISKALGCLGKGLNVLGVMKRKLDATLKTSRCATHYRKPFDLLERCMLQCRGLQKSVLKPLLVGHDSSSDTPRKSR